MDGWQARPGLEEDGEHMLHSPLQSYKCCAAGSNTVGKHNDHGSDGPQVSSFGSALPALKKYKSKTYLFPIPTVHQARLVGLNAAQTRKAEWG